MPNFKRQSNSRPLRIFAVDDQPEANRALKRALHPYGFEVETCEDADAAIAIVRERGADFDAMVLDRFLPSIDGIELIERIREVAPLPVVMLTADSGSSGAVAAMEAGAFSYLTKPCENDVLASVLNSATQHSALLRRHRELENAIDSSDDDGSIVGSSDAIQKLHMVIDRIAKTDASVLVLGESGTGKELVARSIHRASARASQPFVAINCGAIPESLIDSELFGHVRGAFTGALAARPGVFVEANGGTLFLDEIGEMPAQVQSRLLRVLQEGEIRALGASSSEKIDVRVIAATHVDLQKAVADGRFRADLYYRLNVVSTRVPPLRERLSDIPLLANHFLAMHHDGDPPPRLSSAAMDVLFEYHWPGNVRELENAIQHGLALGGPEISVESLPATICTAVGARISGAVQAIAAIGAMELGLAEPVPLAQGTLPPGAIIDAQPPYWFDDIPFGEAKKRAQRDFERAYVERMLDRANGNITQAARLAGLDRSNFRRVMVRADAGGDDTSA